MSDVLDFCREYGISEDEFYGRSVIRRSLYINCSLHIPKEFSPVICGSLHLFVNSLPDGFSPIVKNSLYLYKVESLPDGFNPVVGNSLFLYMIRSLPIDHSLVVGDNLYFVKDNYWNDYDLHHSNNLNFTSWRDGKYIKVDGILSKVLSHKGNVWKVKNIGSNIITYIVTDGFNYAHGNTIKDARESLKYKISDRDTSQYDNLTLESELSMIEMAKCYRVITGACEHGVREFIKTQKTKPKYKIKEIIDLTKNRFGNNSFSVFFNKKLIH